ncbi:MAG: hypothetical protein LAT68_05935 [Cyclobacteriaceae bacterium]|nr:hypothetical protein [Cyclobacteriaceae bacterium]MCH8515852.1 hypothetical protein [Cyclobacteriaceae bacterium]
MSKNTVAAYFEQQLSEWENAFQQAHQSFVRISLIRVLLFVGGVSLIVYFANERMFTAFGLALTVFILLFLFFLKQHQQARRKKQLADSNKSYYSQEIKRLNLNLEGLEDGKVYQENGDESFASDLDLFGNHSLFQLLNRTTDEGGARALASLMQAKFPEAEEMRQRQELVSELKDNYAAWVGYRNKAALHESEEKASLDGLVDWCDVKDGATPFIPSSLKYASLIKVVLIVQLLVVIALCFVGLLPYQVGFLSFIINLVVAFFYGRNLAPIAEMSQQALPELKSKQHWLQAMVDLPLNSTMGQALTQKCGDSQLPAHLAIEKLNALLYAIETRGNLLYPFLNGFALYDLSLLQRAAKWHRQHAAHFEQWLEVSASLEVYFSLAAHAFAHPEINYPSYSEGDLKIEAEQLAHPLLAEEGRVANDFRFDAQKKIILVTGSNMAGKSTFLRTIGVNMVLAGMGSPVCGKSMSLSRFRLFSALRTTDNLKESVSSFYAELKKLNALIAMGKEVGQPPVFFLIDEILKGTNSNDRKRGAEALIRQLSKINTMGIISTHDVELAALTEEVDTLINYSFNSSIESGEIIFDYLLTSGVCKSFNATELMRKMGIEVDQAKGGY